MITQTAPRVVTNLFCAVAGQVFCIECFDDQSTQAVSQLIKHYCLAPLDVANAGQVDFTLRIKRSSLPTVPRGLPQRVVAGGFSYSDGDRFYLNVYDSMVVSHSASSRLLDIYIGETPHALQAVSSDYFNNVVACGIRAALRRCGIFPLHAAGVLEPESGRCALIIGPSGCGKSSLAIRLAANNWRYLSDDLVVLSTGRDGVIEARGFRNVFSITESSLAAFSLHGLREALGGYTSSEDDKRRLDPAVAFPSGFAKCGIPGTLFFSEISRQAETRIVELTPKESLRRLIRECEAIFHDLAVSRDYLKALASLVKQSNQHLLLAGNDLLTSTPLRAAELLAPFMKR